MQASARAFVIAVAGVSAVLGPSGIPTANAGPFAKPALADARSHLELGNKLYNVRSFDEAIVEYKAGALIEPAPVFDYNLGQCYRFLGKYEDSIWHYERFLARGKPEGKALDAVHDFIAQMRSELDKKAMTQKPTDAAPGASQPPTDAAPSAAPSASQPDRPSQSPPLPEQAVGVRTEAWYRDGFGWGLTGAGVVGLAVGGGFLASASSLRADANATKIQGEYNRLRDKANTRDLLGAVIGIGGAGVLVTGIIKLAIHSEGPDRVAEWNVSASGDGFIVFGRF
jgi:tetratricopeptide (TPR) repeat protein